MCGIALAFTRKNSNAEIMQRLLEALNHRGPDKKNMVTFALRNAPDWTIAMGHTRLAIVGLGAIGDQPKVLPGQSGMIFNGEIYGTAAGQSLRQSGVVSDTEWLWQRFEATKSISPEPGTDGIWGIASFDATEEVISVTRDPLGVIPVYAYEWQGGLIISSEIQAIAKAVGPLPIDLPELVAGVASRQLSYGRYIKGLSCISPGETRRYEIRNGTVNCRRTVPREFLTGYLHESRSFGEAFNHAVLKQFQADVPVGIQLSGGVDSSLIAATLAMQGQRSLNTFVARTQLRGRDEADLAIANARGLGLKPPVEVLIDRRSFSDEILSSIGRIDPAFSHPNFFAVKRIARAAHDMGIKVLLCGEGADELFRGYSRLLPSNVARLFNSKMSHTLLKAIDHKRLNFDEALGKTVERQMEASVALYYQWVEDPSIRHLFCNYLHELLYRQNIAGMVHSLEVRPPFLDFSVVGYAMTHPKSFFNARNGKKYLLKGDVKSHLDSIFPNYVGPKRKIGFSMPLHNLLNNEATSLLQKSVKNSKNNLGINRDQWFSKYIKNQISNFEFERYLWPAIVTTGALTAAGHSV
jgi:asparagine synthase (glutamine-hydrolysing)